MTSGRPVIARGIASADPNYENTPADDAPLRENDLLLLNLYARKAAPGAVHADITWMAFVGRTPAIPPRVQKVWKVTSM